MHLHPPNWSVKILPFRNFDIISLLGLVIRILNFLGERIVSLLVPS